MSRGADVNLRDRHGWTPLHFAAQALSSEVTSYLLARGASVDTQDEHGNTPLFRATFAYRGEGAVIELLRSAGADPKKKNKSGVSALELARTIANYDVAKLYDDVVGSATADDVTNSSCLSSGREAMKEPTLDQLREAFRAHDVEAPPEYVWLVQHRTLGFDAFTQFEPWHFCGVEEILPLSKRWPKAALQRELIPFARMQGSDDLVCFEFAAGRVIQVCHLHYDLGPPVYVEFHKEYPTIWDWLDAALSDLRFWFEQAQREKEKSTD